MSHLTLIPASSLRVTSWSDHGELHKVVMGMFQSTELPGAENERRLSRNILFRVDESTAGKTLLIRADVAPTNLPKDARTKDVGRSNILAGTPVRFRLTANAIRRSKPENTTIKRGHGSNPVDRMGEWVAGKLAGGLTDVAIFDHTRTVVTSGRAPLQIDVIDGHGIVYDPEILDLLLTSGVGRSKAFGCGLLTLARA